MTTPPKPKSRFLYRLLRDGALILAVCTVILAIAVFRRPSQGAMLYYQYQAMHGSGPAAGQPAFWSTPFSRAATVAAMKHFGDDNDADGDDPGSDDKCTPLPDHLVPPGGIGDPAALASLNRYMQFILPDGMQVVFSHALSSSDGQQRLVIVAVGPERFSHELLPPLAWEAMIVQPAGWTSTPTSVGRQHALFDTSWVDASPTTFLVGSANDDSFDVPFQSGSHTGHLTGKLIAGARKLAISEN